MPVAFPIGRTATPQRAAALWMMLAAAGFGSMAAVVKLLGNRLDPAQIVFFRALFVLLTVLPAFPFVGWHNAIPRYPVRHLWRGATSFISMVCAFYAFTHLPLAMAVSITFAGPLFLIVIAVLFLGETVRWRRWTATLVGFGGVLIMLRPGAGGFDGGMDGFTLGVIAALGNALFVAASSAQVKAMPRDETVSTLLFSFGVISTVLLIVPCWLVWQDPTPAEWGLLVLMGLLGAGAQAAIIRAYRVGAEATFVAPFDYLRLLVAAVLGYWLFAEVPDIWTAAGALVIIASTLYIARREARLGKPD